MFLCLRFLALHVFNITCGACKAWQTLVTCHVYLGLLVTIVDHSYLYTVRSVARTGNFFERAYMWPFYICVYCLDAQISLNLVFVLPLQLRMVHMIPAVTQRLMWMTLYHRLALLIKTKKMSLSSSPCAGFSWCRRLLMSLSHPGSTSITSNSMFRNRFSGCRWVKQLYANVYVSRVRCSIAAV
jgi:hypothetical protein